MPQSLAAVLVHIVFSTKNREPFIDQDIEPDVQVTFAGGEVILSVTRGEGLIIASVEDFGEGIAEGDLPQHQLRAEDRVKILPPQQSSKLRQRRDNHPMELLE